MDPFAANGIGAGDGEKVALHCAAGRAGEIVGGFHGVPPTGCELDRSEALQHIRLVQWAGYVLKAASLLRNKTIRPYLEALASRLLRKRKMSGNEVRKFLIQLTDRRSRAESNSTRRLRVRRG